MLYCMSVESGYDVEVGSAENQTIATTDDKKEKIQNNINTHRHVISSSLNVLKSTQVWPSFCDI